MNCFYTHQRQYHRANSVQDINIIMIIITVNNNSNNNSLSILVFSPS